MKRVTQIILIIMTQLRLDAASITNEDIIILEITSQDIGKKIVNEKEYNDNLSNFRKKITEYLHVGAPQARYTVINMYFDQYFGNQIDLALLDAFRKSKNVTLSVGDTGKKLFTHRKFAETLPEIGHFMMDYPDEQTVEVLISICTSWTGYVEPIEECPKENIKRHVGVIAAEAYLKRKTNVSLDSEMRIKRRKFKPLRRITFSEFSKSPAIISEKIVILTNFPYPDEDWKFHINHETTITGSEVLGNIVREFINVLGQE